MSFNALIVNKDDEGKTHAEVTQITEDQLPEAEVTVAVDYSTVNYKDGLCIGPGGGLVRNYPHVPGIDFAGTVETSSDERYKAGELHRDAGGDGVRGPRDQERAGAGHGGRGWRGLGRDRDPCQSRL